MSKLDRSQSAIMLMSRAGGAVGNRGNVTFRTGWQLCSSVEQAWRRYQLLGSSLFRCQLEFCFKNAAELRFSRPSF